MTINKFVRYDAGRGFAIGEDRYGLPLVSFLREKGWLMKMTIADLYITFTNRRPAAYKQPPRPATLSVWLGQTQLVQN